jgi:predicted GIY-YIG superfamily endonuclease
VSLDRAFVLELRTSAGAGFVQYPPTVSNGPEKRFVYIIRSESNPDSHYTGLTSNVSNRLILHNTAKTGHTAEDRPWRLVVAVECEDEQVARRFERYLKGGSGRAFAKRHFRHAGVVPGA